MKAQKWILRRQFDGEPKDGDMELQEETLPPLKGGDVLLEGLVWSVDPYMRPGANFHSAGSLMSGQQLARVVESRSPAHPVGSKVLASVGWRSRTVCNPSTLPPTVYAATEIPAISPAPDTADLGDSVTVGVLGMPGATAYLGFLDICRPEPGDTVLVNGAAGAVGSIVGQIAKIKGCTVIGFAGTDEKVDFITKTLGFDFGFNYKKVNVNDALNQAAPGGIDCFFDNVGGSFTTDVILRHMKDYGRVAVCGSISAYNNDPTKVTMAPELFVPILFKQLTVRGFIVYRWVDRFPEAWDQLRAWIKEGRLKYREHKTVGFENMYSAFRGMLKGDNIGKAVITKS